MSETDSPRPEPPRALPPPVPPGATAAPPRRLYRDPQGPIGGVASGMAAYFELDPVIVRLMWIVALLTGVGFFAYLVSWVVIPKAKIWPPDGYTQPVTRDGRSNAMVSGLVIVALAALIGNGIDGMGDLLLPAALIGFGVYLLNERSSRSETAGSDLGSAAAAPLSGASDWTEGSATRAEPFVRASAVEGPSGVVTPTVLSLLAIAAGVCWALAAAGLLQPSVLGLAAGGLVLVGLGLLASLWLGRAPGLTLLGVGLTGALVVASAVEPWVARAREFQAHDMAHLKLDHFRDVAGDLRFDPQSLAELEPVYGLGMGELTVDLSEIDFTGATRDVEIQLGMGKATVIVPDDVHVDVDGHVALGKASALDLISEGMGATVQTSDAALDAGTLRVKFAVGLGEGMVRREE